MAAPPAPKKTKATKTVKPVIVNLPNPNAPKKPAPLVIPAPKSSPAPAMMAPATLPLPDLATSDAAGTRMADVPASAPVRAQEFSSDYDVPYVGAFNQPETVQDGPEIQARRPYLATPDGSQAPLSRKVIGPTDPPRPVATKMPPPGKKSVVMVRTAEDKNKFEMPGAIPESSPVYIAPPPAPPAAPPTQKELAAIGRDATDDLLKGFIAGLKRRPSSIAPGTPVGTSISELGTLAAEPIKTAEQMRLDEAKVTDDALGRNLWAGAGAIPAALYESDEMKRLKALRQEYIQRKAKLTGDAAQLASGQDQALEEDRLAPLSEAYQIARVTPEPKMLAGGRAGVEHPLLQYLPKNVLGMMAMSQQNSVKQVLGKLMRNDPADPVTAQEMSVAMADMNPNDATSLRNALIAAGTAMGKAVLDPNTSQAQGAVAGQAAGGLFGAAGVGNQGFGAATGRGAAQTRQGGTVYKEQQQTARNNATLDAQDDRQDQEIYSREMTAFLSRKLQQELFTAKNAHDFDMQSRQAAINAGLEQLKARLRPVPGRVDINQKKVAEIDKGILASTAAQTQYSSKAESFVRAKRAISDLTFALEAAGEDYEAKKRAISAAQLSLRDDGAALATLKIDPIFATASVDPTTFRDLQSAYDRVEAEKVKFSTLNFAREDLMADINATPAQAQVPGSLPGLGNKPSQFVMPPVPTSPAPAAQRPRMAPQGRPAGGSSVSDGKTRVTKLPNGDMAFDYGDHVSIHHADGRPPETHWKNGNTTTASTPSPQNKGVKLTPPAKPAGAASKPAPPPPSKAKAPAKKAMAPAKKEPTMAERAAIMKKYGGDN